MIVIENVIPDRSDFDLKNLTSGYLPPLRFSGGGRPATPPITWWGVGDYLPSAHFFADFDRKRSKLIS